jgi:hypothetical protein
LFIGLIANIAPEAQKWFVPRGRLTIKKGRCFLYIVSGEKKLHLQDSYKKYKE